MDTRDEPRDTPVVERTTPLWTLVAVLRNAAMHRSLVAFGLFGTAEMATWVALLVWAHGIGGARAAGIIAVAQLVPATLVAPLGSVLADRVARPRALAIGYLAQAATNLLTGVTLLLDAPFWVVCVAAAAAACAMTLSRPAHYALLPEIARTPEELTAGNTASTTTEGVSDFAGPALAGLLLLAVSAGTLFLLMTAAGLLSALATRGLPVTPACLPPDPAEREEEPSYWADVHEGIRTVVRDPAANVLSTLVGGQFVVVGLLEVLAVVIALELLATGAAGPGLLTSALGIGAIVGAGATVSLIGRRRLTPAIGLGILATSLPIALIAFSSSFLTAAVLFGIAGAGKAYVDVAARTLLQRAVTPGVLARVFGVQEALLMAGTAVGSALVPVFVALFGTEGAVVAASLVLPVTGAVLWPRIRRLDVETPVLDGAIDLLCRVPMLAVLSPGALEQAARGSRWQRFAAGQVVIAQGQPGDCFYVIRTGAAQVERDGHPVNVLLAGASFGETALLHDRPRNATVTALQDLEVLVLQRDAFLFAVTGSRESLRLAQRTIRRHELATEGRDPEADGVDDDRHGDLDARP